jgi:hypothetical protein
MYPSFESAEDWIDRCCPKPDYNLSSPPIYPSFILESRNSIINRDETIVNFYDDEEFFPTKTGLSIKQWFEKTIEPKL